MTRKGFTLIELLVVIAIIAMLMSILMPALARVKELANRVVCGSNLKGVGTAMGIYGNEDENGRFPRAGYRNGEWGDSTTMVWDGPIQNPPVDPFPNDKATISASLYLLIKGDYATTKNFHCRSDPDTSGVFRHSDPWNICDFGASPWEFCSYAYQLPYDNTDAIRPVTSASNSAMAVAADRSPEPDGGESHAHQDEGQNVLFVDGHVTFERPVGGDLGRECGIDGDDIYTIGIGGFYDSYLVNEPLP